jgi:ketosteroid isomerase-like protein
MQDQLIKQFQEIEDNFSRAIISNDVKKIKPCISEDWCLVGGNGILAREKFLELVEKGTLSHSSMKMEVSRVKVYGHVAVVTGRERNTGMWQGNPIQADKWVTAIYRKTAEGWHCVLSHLAPATESQ